MTVPNDADAGMACGKRTFRAPPGGVPCALCGRSGVDYDLIKTSAWANYDPTRRIQVGHGIPYVCYTCTEVGESQRHTHYHIVSHYYSPVTDCVTLSLFLLQRVVRHMPHVRVPGVSKEQYDALTEPGRMALQALWQYVRSCLLVRSRAQHCTQTGTTMCCVVLTPDACSIAGRMSVVLPSVRRVEGVRLSAKEYDA